MTTPTVGDKYLYLDLWVTVEHIGKRRIRLRHVTDDGNRITVWVTHRRWPGWSAGARGDAAMPRDAALRIKCA